MSSNFNHVIDSCKELKPFRYWCQKVLPLVYDDSLSYYELLCKVVEYLNYTIDSLNKTGQAVTEFEEAYKQLKEYVDNYFSNIDVQKEINNKLDDMSASGALSDIILNSSSRIGYQKINFDNYLMKNFNAFFNENEINVLQGGTNANNTIIISLTNNNFSSAKLIELNVSGDIIRKSTVFNNLYHSNDMCFYNDKIYVATGRNQIIVINYNDFSLNKVIETNIECWNISFDGVFYVTDGTVLIIYDTDFTEISRTRLDFYYYGNQAKLTKQSSFAKNGIFYYQMFSENNGVYNNNFICCFDKGGNCLNYISFIPIYGTQEIESMFIINNVLYAISGQNFFVMSKASFTSNVLTDEPMTNYYYAGSNININSDLNDFLTPGKYSCGSGSTAETLINCPYKYSLFTLDVVTHGTNMIYQKITGIDGVSYTRRYNRVLDLWDEWYKIPTITPLNKINNSILVNNNASTIIDIVSIPPLKTGIIFVTIEFNVRDGSEIMLAIDGNWLQTTSSLKNDNTRISASLFINNNSANKRDVPINVLQRSTSQLTCNYTISVLLF